MKKTIFTITAATALIFASCGKTTKAEEGTATADSTGQAAPEAPETVEAAPAAKAEASVVGEWKLSDIDLGMEVPKGKEKQFEEMKKKMIGAMSYTIKDDGTMSLTTPMMDTPVSATYTYADSKMVITDSKTKKVETVTVDELTDNKMVISTEQNGKKTTMTFSK